MLTASHLFDLDQTAHADLFAGTTYAWEALPRLGPYLQQRLSTDKAPNGYTQQVHPSVVIEGDVHIGADTTIAPGVYIQGPTLIGDGCQVRHGAHVRANTLLADGGIIGHATETKNAIMLENAHAPHFAYVGDSILGRGVNLGAGTKLSNYPMNVHHDPQTGLDSTIQLKHAGQQIDTGLIKLGAILGDGVSTGCNVVTNPGTIVGRGTLVYTLTMLRKGVYPPHSIIKLRQNQEIVDIHPKPA